MQPSIARMTRPEVQIGSVSRGTQTPYDLHRSFAALFAKLNPEGFEQLFHPANGHSVFQSDAVCNPTHDWWKSEKAIEVIAILEDALNECAPNGMFFGASYGDGSDYGFWEYE